CDGDPVRRGQERGQARQGRQARETLTRTDRMASGGVCAPPGSVVPGGGRWRGTRPPLAQQGRGQGLPAARVDRGQRRETRRPCNCVLTFQTSLPLRSTSVSW